MTSPIFTYVVDDARKLGRNVELRLNRLREAGFKVHICAAENDALWALSDRGCVVRPLTSRPNAALPVAFLVLQAHLIENPPMIVHGMGFPWAWAAVAATKHLDATRARVVSVDGHVTRVDELAQPYRDLLTSLRAAGVDTILRPRCALYRWLGTSSNQYVVPSERERGIVVRSHLVDEASLSVIHEDDHDAWLNLYDHVLREELGIV